MVLGPGILAGLALLLAGCTAKGLADRKVVAEIAEHHERDHSRFDDAKADFALRNPVPLEFDYGDEGTIVADEVALEGFPGREELWFRYTWINTTGRTVDAVHVTLQVFDTESGFEVGQEMRLSPPLLTAFGPGSTYSTFVRVVAGDAKLGGGLSWELRPRTQSWRRTRP